MSFADDALTCDGFLGGRIRLLQPRSGYRAAMDPVLLAAFVPARPGESVLDMGCGAGAAVLCLGARVPGLDLHGLEVQEDYADLARRNAVRNGIELAVHEGDVRSPPRSLLERTFDQVITNPPYYAAMETTSPRDAGRRSAHLEGGVDLRSWIAACLRRTVQGGRISLIHRAGRLPEILAALTPSCGGIQLVPVRSRRGRSASRVLVRARKGSSAQFELHSDLTIHAGSVHVTDQVDYTEDAGKILRHMQELLIGAR